MFFSIVVISFNSEETISKTIDSIYKQTYKNYEVIFVDSLSQDNTKRIIGNSKFSDMKFVYEKDNGIYDALNKGIKYAKGEYIINLHSDNYFASDYVLSDIFNQLMKNNYDCLYSDIEIKNLKKNKVLRYCKSENYNNDLFINGWMPNHPSLVVKTSILRKYNYDNSYKVSSDYKLMLYLLHIKKISSIYLQKKTIVMNSGGISNSSIKNILLANYECYKILKYYNFKYPIIIILKKLLRKVKQLKL